MEADVMEIVEMELKYCERCGALWLRVRGNPEVYCAACLPQIDEMARWRPRRRPKLPSAVKIEGRCGEMVTLLEGGEA